jgi:hypothetical protein
MIAPQVSRHSHLRAHSGQKNAAAGSHPASGQCHAPTKEAHGRASTYHSIVHRAIPTEHLQCLRQRTQMRDLRRAVHAENAQFLLQIGVALSITPTRTRVSRPGRTTSMRARTAPCTATTGNSGSWSSNSGNGWQPVDKPEPKLQTRQKMRNRGAPVRPELQLDAQLPRRSYGRRISAALAGEATSLFYESTCTSIRCRIS